jgi:hypothetical protein
MSYPVTCPHCETALRVTSSTAARIVCPSCQSRLPNPHPLADTAGDQEAQAYLADAEVDAAPALVGCTGCLSMFGVVAIPFIFMMLILALAADWRLGLAFLGGLIWLGLLSAGIMMWQTRDRPEERSVGRILSGMLVLLGTLAVTFFALVVVFLVISIAGL